ncbi:glycosyltransferase [Sphingobacterium thermophilum]|uniref:Glycosyl transferase family 1 domain-containing protein n=1 Tax=Sphingobacterium thermophilum TaxID=768534 RepID=A0ABP8R0B8_9SPHI
MKIAQVAAIKENKASGLSFSIPNLIKGFKAIGIQCDLINLNNKDLDISALSSYNIVVLNSFFLLQYLKILVLVKKKIKIIVTPRGAFSSRNHYSLKKRIYSFLYFFIIKFRNLDVSIHYLTERERELSRFINFPSFVCGNSIQGDDILRLTDLRKKDLDTITITYIGRFIPEIKGLDKLINQVILDQTIIRGRKIQINLYGPNSPYKTYLERLCKEKNILDIIFFKGEVFGEKKEEVLRNTDFHILTSRSEGYPMSVLESLAKGIPQILSEGTNLLSDLEHYNFGVGFDKEVFTKISALNPQDYHLMCVNALKYSEMHCVSNIAKKTFEGYLK